MVVSKQRLRYSHSVFFFAAASLCRDYSIYCNVYSSENSDTQVQLMLDLARTIIRHLERTDSELTFEDWKKLEKWDGQRPCFLFLWLLEIGTFFCFLDGAEADWDGSDLGSCPGRKQFAKHFWLLTQIAVASLTTNSLGWPGMNRKWGQRIPLNLCAYLFLCRFKKAR